MSSPSVGRRTQRRPLEHNIQITGSDIGEIESVQPKAGSQLLTHLNSADAVTVFVEPRGERRNTQLAINNCYDSTAHSTLRRNPYLVCPLPRKVVHSASEHDRQHIL